RDAPGVVDVGEHGGLDVGATLAARNLRDAAAGHEAGALLDAERDVVESGSALSLGDHRAHLGRLVERLSDADLRRPLGQALHEVIVDGSLDEEPGARAAILSAVAEHGPEGPLDREVEAVNPTLDTLGSDTSALPTVEPGPGRTEIVSGGRPASTSRSASISTDSGV